MVATFKRYAYDKVVVIQIKNNQVQAVSTTESQIVDTI